MDLKKAFMNGIDYSKSLARERENYLKNLQDKDRATKNEIETMQDTHDHVQKNQREVYKNDKAQLENKFQDRVETISSDQRDALIDKSKKYDESMATEKKRFFAESQGTQKDFKNRLDNLKENYAKNTAESERITEAQNKNNENNYKTRIKQVSEDNQKKVDKFQNTAEGDLRSTNEIYAKDKKEFIGKKEQEKIDLVKEEAAKRNLMRDQVVKNVDGLKTQREQERITNWEMQKARFDELQKDSNNRIESSQNKSKEAQDKVSESQKKEIQEQSRVFNKRYSDQEKFFNDSVRNLEMKEKRSANATGSLRHNLAAKDQFLKDEQTRGRINHIIEDRNNLQTRFNDEYEGAIDKFQDKHQEQTIEAAHNLEKKEQALLMKNFADSSENRMKRDGLSQQFSTGMKNQMDINSNQEKHLHESSKQQINHLKENFHKSITELTDKNNSNFDKMKQTAAEEQKKIMADISKQNSSDKADLKKQFISKIEVLNQIFDKKVNSLESANAELRGRFEDTVNQMAYQSKKEVERLTEGHEKNMVYAVESERKIGQSKTEELKQTIARIENQFSNKMISEKRLSEKQLRDYQLKNNEQLDMLKKKYDGMIADINRSNERDKTRLVEEQNFKVKAIASQYESQIQNYKDREAANIAAMRDFKSAQNNGGSEKA